MPLTRVFRTLLIPVTAALVIVLLTVAYEAAHVVVGECDGKFGCRGGIWFAVMFSGIAALVSGGALVLVAAACANTLAQVPSRSLVLVGVVAGLALTVLLRTVPQWPFDPFAMAALWASLTAVIGVALILVACRRQRSKLRASRAVT